jgi:hypothetical protein
MLVVEALPATSLSTPSEMPSLRNAVGGDAAKRCLYDRILCKKKGRHRRPPSPLAMRVPQSIFRLATFTESFDMVPVTAT